MSDELREKYTPTTDEVIRGYRLPHRVVDPQRSGESMAEWLGRCSIESHGIQLESEAAARRWLARERAAAKVEQREADAVITDGPHPANSGLDSFTLAHIGFAIRAAGTETGETS